ncbi:MAG: hypothetical protein O2816_10445, partial [Planctomycetota bacterium]|nr:hypothetical protein [Planctomycetota bacterium]
ALALLGLLAGCSGEAKAASNTSDDPAFEFSSGGPAFLDLAADAPWNTVFRGIRLVKLYHEAPGFEYREEVGADGEGGFNISTLEVLTAHPNPGVLLALQDLRQTLSYRYRDFVIRDLALFQQNYAIAIIDAQRSVAGIPTVQLRIDRMQDAHSAYLVDFDPTTGLVLAYQEYDLVGNLVADVAFESFTYDADLTGLNMVSYLYETTPVSMNSGQLQSAFKFDPLIPSYLPQGYSLLDSMDKQVAEDGTRAKVYMTDGLEMLILSSMRPTIGPKEVTASRMFSSDLGTWRGMLGEVNGIPVLIAGKVDLSEQSLVLQSALD